MFISEHKAMPKLFQAIEIWPPFNRLVFEGTLKECKNFLNETRRNNQKTTATD
jgi:hypothetical protein